MKLYAKILPKYFKEHEEGAKHVEYRQLESMMLLNSETGEEIEFEIVSMRKSAHSASIIEDHPEIPWKKSKDIYVIRLGRKL